MSEPARAIFVSYAREDTGVAGRLAGALREAGLEVWFDRSELRGGDTWDHKIRRQIRECALFMPVISAQTQQRSEGYFRREWKLAVERTHDMARGVPFLVPVAVDDTREDHAAVPDEFMHVQWTRLPGGEATAEFAAQVRRLLESRQTVPPHARAGSGGTPPALADPRRPASGVRRWVAGLVVVALLTAAGVFWLGPHRGGMADKSIAVLPFDNLSENKADSAFFADGMHEDVIMHLALLRDLHVISRTSVMEYRNTTKNIRRIGEELGVAWLLEGSVQRVGNKVRVIGQLINAHTDVNAWAGSYDRDLTDVFGIQTELSQAIAGALAAKISPEERRLLERRPTANAAAYDFYLRARAMYQDGSQEVDAMAQQLTDAVQLDPNFAQAWAQLAVVHATARFNGTDLAAARQEKARGAMETAMRLAPDDPTVVELQGDFFYYGARDYGKAAGQYERLLTLRPNSAAAIGSLGLIYRRQARWPEALANLRRALELDPRNVRYRDTLARHLRFVRHYDEAQTEFRRLAADAPDNLARQVDLAQLPFFARGSTREADAWFAQWHPPPGGEAQALYFRKQWLRLRGDYAGAIRLDEQQPYFEDGRPHWLQDALTARDYLAAGEAAVTRTRLEKVRAELETERARQAANPIVWMALGLVAGVQGDRAQALGCAAKMRELLPESVDAVTGPDLSAFRAQILAWAGEKEEALAELARLLRTPYGQNVFMARQDFLWQPLRADPRFEALLDDPRNNEPLF